MRKKNPDVTLHVPRILVNENDVNQSLNQVLLESTILEEIYNKNPDDYFDITDDILGLFKEKMLSAEKIYVPSGSSLGDYEVSVCTINGRRYTTCSSCHKEHEANQGIKISYEFEDESGEMTLNLCSECQEKYKDAIRQIFGWDEMFLEEDDEP